MRRIHRHLTFANAVSRTRLRAIGNQRLLLLVGLLALAAAPAPASGAKTRIVWSRFEHRTGSRLQLVSAHPNGRHLRVLTHPGKHIQDIDASISPNGRRVVSSATGSTRKLPRSRSWGQTARTSTRSTSAVSTPVWLT